MRKQLRFSKRTSRFMSATSFGGAETLVQSPAEHIREYDELNEL